MSAQKSILSFFGARATPPPAAPPSKASATTPPTVTSGNSDSSRPSPSCAPSAPPVTPVALGQKFTAAPSQSSQPAPSPGACPLCPTSLVTLTLLSLQPFLRPPRSLPPLAASTPPHPKYQPVPRRQRLPVHPFPSNAPLPPLSKRSLQTTTTTLPSSPPYTSPTAATTATRLLLLPPNASTLLQKLLPSSAATPPGPAPSTAPSPRSALCQPPRASQAAAAGIPRLFPTMIKCDIFNRYGSAKFEAANSERYHWLEDVRDAQGRRLGETGAPVIRRRLVCCLRVTAPASGYDSRTLFVPKDAAKKFTPFEGQVRCHRCMPLTNLLSKSLNAAVLVYQVSKLRRCSLL
jgi:hypothetical protein